MHTFHYVAIKAIPSFSDILMTSCKNKVFIISTVSKIFTHYPVCFLVRVALWEFVRVFLCEEVEDYITDFIKWPK